VDIFGKQKHSNPPASWEKVEVVPFSLLEITNLLMLGDNAKSLPMADVSYYYNCPPADYSCIVL
jgi:hypothetical protein